MNLTEHFQGLCTRPDGDLLEALIRAHYAAARDNANLSKQVVGEAAVGSGDFAKAAVAGLLSFGGLHGPVLQARSLLRNATPEKISAILSDRSLRIPGWGNSFFKNRVDPAWDDVVVLLRERPIWQTIEMIDAVVKSYGKTIHPNAALFSAACMEEMVWLDGTEMLIVLVARAPVWALEFARATQALPRIPFVS
ncbi:MAG: hypothetical protein ABI634_08205 [Acidobacteriota bacterium]